MEEIRNAYRRLFMTPVGAVVLTDLAEYCGFLVSHGGDPYQEGQRDVFLHIMEMYGIQTTLEVGKALQAIPAQYKELENDTDDGA